MSNQIQRRTAPGKSGKPIKVRVNAFHCVQLPTGLVQHHSVKFSAGLNRADRDLCIKYLAATKQLFLGAPPVGYTFDGRANLFMLAPTPMPDHKFSVDENVVKQEPVKPGQKARMIQIEIEHAAVVPVAALIDLINGRCSNLDDTDTNTAIQALNIVMKRPPVYDKGYTTKGPKFYMPKEETVEGKLLAEIFQGQNVRNYLGAACELWGGYFASIRPGIGKMLLIVNRTNAPLIKSGNLVDILMEYMNIRTVTAVNPLNPKMPKDVRIKILRFVKGMNVRVSTRSARDMFKIKNVDQKSAKTHIIDHEKGKISVEEYFKRTHNITLKYPDLPVVQLTKTAFFPMECCDVWVGTNFFKKLAAQQTSEMLKGRFATLSPGVKKTAIAAGLTQLSINSAYHKAWNIQINPNFMEVGARQLPGPQLAYRNARGGPATVKTNDGAWMTKGMQAFRGGSKVNRWIIVVFTGNNPATRDVDGMPTAQVQNAIGGFIKACKAFGMTFGTEQPTIFHAGDTQEVMAAIVQGSKKAGYGPQNPPDLVVTYSYGSRQYDRIKQVCDVTLGVASQNLQIGKADGGRETYWINVAFKVNAKMNGVNHTIAAGLPHFAAKPTMLFGADVTHPSAGSCIPSIAAVVASYDKLGVEYTCQTNVQESRQEIIGSLAEMTTEHLKTFFSKNKVKPARIIFYRDGVSEGQFQEVANKEIAVIKGACSTLEPGYNPAITFIICAKRHHTQMFPSSEKDADRSGNVKAGTVIDTEVVHPSFNDLYLVSQAGLLGTSKPTHYTILLDESKFGNDVLEKLTFELAFLMPRSTRSISIAAPAQFAHMVCERTRKWIGNMDAESDQMFLAGKKEDEIKTELLSIARARKHQAHANRKNVMFYM